MLAAKFIQRTSIKFCRRAFAAPVEAVASAQLTLNFNTPHAPVYKQKVVESVILPGSAGEYGVTANHSPIISELRPGVVTVLHSGVSCRKKHILCQRPNISTMDILL
jgi:hypothetical protein